ncbi:MAG: HD domain-containing protein [Victivallaceae bacterium]|nr:HD domain-containing protein [Victivallaceae bacterium]MDD4180530.1 HD domain-containing protein [Victivallaceae bacterium]
MQLARLEKDIFKLFERDLSPEYYYHCEIHTLHVMKEVEVFGRAAGVSKHNMKLLRTAAILHDCGYLECYRGNEKIAAKFAEQILGSYNYTPEDIVTVSGMIRATERPCNPQNKLEELMCDADCGYLGTDDFLPMADCLKRELEAHGESYTDCEWYSFELKFLESFNFFTKEAAAIRNDGLAKNIKKLRKLIEDCR